MTSSVLKKLVHHNKLPALLISNLTNIRYLSGLQVSAGVILISHSGEPVMFLDPRYVEEAKSLGRIAVQPIEKLPAVFSSLQRCGIEADDVTLTRLHRWKKQFKNTKFVQTSGLIEGLRRTKNESELRSISIAVRITKKLLKAVPALLIPGITERGLATRLLLMAQEAGAEEMAFPTIVAFGKNTSYPHHHASNRAFRVNDLVQIDLGVRVNGYCSDMSRIFALRPFHKEEEKSYRALIKAKKSAENMLKAGVTNHALDKAARSALAAFGIDRACTHAVGHGVGLDIHEGISISQSAPKQKLLKNEVVTIEPGVYFPGTFGMRIEDTYIIRS